MTNVQAHRKEVLGKLVEAFEPAKHVALSFSIETPVYQYTIGISMKAMLAYGVLEAIDRTIMIAMQGDDSVASEETVLGFNWLTAEELEQTKEGIKNDSDFVDVTGAFNQA